MSEPAFDVVIRGGTVATASDVFAADVGIAGGVVSALGARLGKGRREIDARGRYVLPGGVDGHCHIEQLTAAGLVNADTWETATASAAFGGTTTVVAFAAQHVGMALPKVLEEYSALAKKGAIIDYAFHIIVADPDERLLKTDLPTAIKAGASSVKLFMTYDKLRVQDEQVLDILMTARENQALVCVHAENHGMLAWMAKRLVERGYIAPKHHAVSHPALAETEAFERLIAMARLVDQPIMIFHVSTKEGAAIIRRARGEGVKIFAETCPQYLFMTAKDLDRPGFEGAKWMCSPPPRAEADQEALWRALALGDIQTVSSDHAPFRFDKEGKLRGGPKATFKQIANGQPGLETRMPLLFDAMVSKGRLGLMKFVSATATEPARTYNLHPRKGTIAVGSDADIAIWNPKTKVTLSDSMMHGAAGYTPWAGRKITGWPETVLRRGDVIVEAGKLKGAAGTGRYLARDGGEAARPSGQLAPEMNPKMNFGADLY